MRRSAASARGAHRGSGADPGLTDDEILTFCKLLLPAGANTTYRSLGLLLVTLMRNPEYLDRIRAARKLIPNAVDELLRTEHSTSLVGRTCIKDTVLGGQELFPRTWVVRRLGGSGPGHGGRGSPSWRWRSTTPIPGRC